MVNKHETSYFIISISDKRLSSFFISLILSLFFYLYLHFPYHFRFNFVVSERNVHILFCRHIWAELSLLVWTFMSGTFFPGCEGGGVHVHPLQTPHPAYAPVYHHELWESLHSCILIKLSPYQHLCCIMFLIASFCSIKSPIFAVFIHISPCFLSVICTPNGKTAEPEYYRRAAKAKERMGGKSLSGCRLELVRSLGRANFQIWKLASTSDSNYANLKLGFSTETNRRHECLSIFNRNQNQTFQGFSSVSVYSSRFHF